MVNKLTHTVTPREELIWLSKEKKDNFKTQLIYTYILTPSVILYYRLMPMTRNLKKIGALPLSGPPNIFFEAPPLYTGT